MLKYPYKIPFDVTLRYLAWRNANILNQILHFWNSWVKGFQMVYRLSRSVDISEEAWSPILASHDKKKPTLWANFVSLFNFNFLPFRFMLFKQVDMLTTADQCSERRMMRYVLPPQVRTPLPTGKIIAACKLTQRCISWDSNHYGC